ncbi:MAG: class I SAM-dependent methyltransferase [Phenylobacterium sp.]|uniref:class I SAM-dependent methyltransferase n=1 Tax=Phenylobacterium sp. TaxID=1871053 RepID=UPI001A52B638|nr:class I SAM-dependent methyltransferase [Phenylobacterium sp.]MBL8770516.1 class I SAM-dependent methyltransferase [Phenylobacterium sp.]
MERQVYDRMRALEQTHWWFAARRDILSSEIARLPLPRPARILEVGCGTGGNLELLKAFGDVQAIEPDAESRAYAAERSGVTVQGGLLPAGLPDLGGPFDLIAAFDVIEHVDDDAGAVAALAARLKPGGALVTTVPACPWMWSEHDEHHHHKRRYRLPAYRRLFEAAGLKVRRATHFNTLLFPPIAAVRALKGAAGLKGDDEALPPAFANRLLRGVFGAETALLRLGSLPFGVSILLIAERP